MSADIVCLCGGDFSTQTVLVQHAHDRRHLLRCSCQRLFASLEYLQNHERDVHPQHTGSFEPLTLFQSPLPASPPTSTHTWNVCHSTLANENGLAMHRQARHPSCPTCQQSFGSAVQLEGHQQATSHCRCAEHALAFTSNDRLRRHHQASLHVTGFECTSCDRGFVSSRALSDHLDSNGHATIERAIQARFVATKRESSGALHSLVKPNEEANLRCNDCNRSFRRLSALHQHKNSVKHNPLSDLHCPMSGECTRVYTSPSALLFHLEGGKCKDGMNRPNVDMLVHQHDNDNGVRISTPTTSIRSRSSNSSIAGDVMSVRSIGPAESEWSFINDDPSGARISTPAVNGSSSSTVMGTANEQHTWPCPASGCGKSFRQQHSLVKHLESPAHAPALCHCPIGLALPAGRRSAKSFKTMSGVLQHLEAGVCVWAGRRLLTRSLPFLRPRSQRLLERV